MSPEEQLHAVKRKKPRSVLSHRPLEAAWRIVRRNGKRSPSIQTQAAIDQFEVEETRNLRALGRELAAGKFVFRPQIGHPVSKGHDKKKRPIVVAAVENRIVQRALLDYLETIPPVVAVLETPTSFGCIKGRGCREAIELAVGRIRDGATYFIKSDIRDFFTSIPRSKVLDFIRGTGVDPWIVDLVTTATETTLANLDELGEDASYFPIGRVGVAQGSALSPLFGNIVLREFDERLNGRGITCIRYVDDFLMLGPNREATRKAFTVALAILKSLGLAAYDPETESKGDQGNSSKGFDFLGRTIVNGLLFPSKPARAKLINNVDAIIRDAKHSLRRIASGKSKSRKDHGVIQTLSKVDNVIRGWSNAHKFCSPGCQAFGDLEKKLDERVSSFFSFVRKLSSESGGSDSRALRQLFGIHLISQTKFEPLLGRQVPREA